MIIMAIKCGKHGRESVYHATVADVRRCYQGQDVEGVQCELDSNSFKHGTAHVERQTFEEVEIPGLGKVPVRKPERFDPEKLEDGFYALPTGDEFEVYKVVIAVHGSGRKYAKRLNIETGEWEMAPGKIRKLRPEHQMTLKQALKVAKAVATDVESRLYGRCFVCGRTLTREDSIKRFMGPICAAKFA